VPKRRRRTGRWVGAALAVLIAVVVIFVAAQGGSSGGGPLDAIAKAAEVTQREPGGRAVLEATVMSSTTPEGITESGPMIFDDSQKARGTLTVRSHDKEGKFLVVVDGKRSYVSSDLLDSIPEGKKWIEVDYSSATAGAGTSTPAQAGPEEGLKVLERVKDAEEVGEEEIDGVATTHYRGTLPAAAEVFGVKVHYSALDVDVWIDGQDRVRRMHLDISGSVGEAEETTTAAMTIDFVEFGRVPTIGVPDPAEVFNATSEVEAEAQSAAEGN
jgi:hypothetical protein